MADKAEEFEPKNTCSVCHKAAKHFCSSCKLVYYCSKECQKKAWKEHKSKCKPFTIELHPVYGRYIVAIRDIKAGEVLLSEKPMVIGPKQKSPAICLGCHRPAQRARCGKCGYPVCDATCQSSKYHKAECAVLAAASPRQEIGQLSDSQGHPAFACIMALRCLLKKLTDPKTWEQINHLQDHLKEIKNGELYPFFMENVVHYLRNRIQFTAFNEDTILKICGIITTNSFEARHNGAKIRGLYYLSSLFAHSCNANTKHVVEDDLAMVFTATVNIPKGTSITTNYTQILWNTMARRQHLQLVKFFLCSCPRCSDPTELGTQYSTLLCDSCRQGTILCKNPLDLDSVWTCNKCDHVLSTRQVKWGDALLYKELREIDKSNPVYLENFLEKYKKTLHPQNRFFVEAKYALIKICGNSPNSRYRDMTRAQLESKVGWCRELLDLSNILNPGLTLLRGSILLELQAAIVALSKRLLSDDMITADGAKDYLKEAADYLKEATEILMQEPDMRQGGLNERLGQLAEELIM